MGGREWQKRRERAGGRERDWQRSRERGKGEIGRTLIKGNIVNVPRWCSQWLQQSVHPVRILIAAQYRCPNTNTQKWYYSIIEQLCLVF